MIKQLKLQRKEQQFHSETVESKLRFSLASRKYNTGFIPKRYLAFLCLIFSVPYSLSLSLLLYMYICYEWEVAELPSSLFMIYNGIIFCRLNFSATFCKLKNIKTKSCSRIFALSHFNENEGLNPAICDTVTINLSLVLLNRLEYYDS